MGGGDRVGALLSSPFFVCNSHVGQVCTGGAGGREVFPGLGRPKYISKGSKAASSSTCQAHGRTWGEPVLMCTRVPARRGAAGEVPGGSHPRRQLRPAPAGCGADLQCNAPCTARADAAAPWGAGGVCVCEGDRREVLTRGAVLTSFHAQDEEEKAEGGSSTAEVSHFTGFRGGGPHGTFFFFVCVSPASLGVGWGVP